jgi:hypothetical protein
MRKVGIWSFLLSGMVWIAAPLPAEQGVAHVGMLPEVTRVVEIAGNPNDTPNQRRRRLHLPIEASFPPPDYGVSEETPNQRRQRLAGTQPNTTAH